MKLLAALHLLANWQHYFSTYFFLLWYLTFGHMKVHIFKYCLLQNRNFLKIFIGYKRLYNTEGLICHTRYDMEFKNRMQKFRFELKKDPTKLKKHLEKERERDKKRRDNKKKLMDNDALEEKRNRDRERQKKCREKKRSIDLGKISSNSHIGSYKSKRSLKKAVTNVKKAYRRAHRRRKLFYSKSLLKYFLRNYQRLCIIPKQKVTQFLKR
ncbi:uncharacterized protein LOC142224429 [Haematobia irritans]|uniref:uncharacterized protein LOC142224429 n=1 Tax=Haematobia irritans TaxID=7368 RepID=UPI003F503E73